MPSTAEARRLAAVSLAVAEGELRAAQEALRLDRESEANRRRYRLALEAHRAAEAAALLALEEPAAC